MSVCWSLRWPWMWLILHQVSGPHIGWSVRRDSSTRGTETMAIPPLTPFRTNVFRSKLSSCGKKATTSQQQQQIDVIRKNYGRDIFRRIFCATQSWMIEFIKGWKTRKYNLHRHLFYIDLKDLLMYSSQGLHWSEKGSLVTSTTSVRLHLNYVYLKWFCF